MPELFDLPFPVGLSPNLKRVVLSLLFIRVELVLGLSEPNYKTIIILDGKIDRQPFFYGPVLSGYEYL